MRQKTGGVKWKQRGQEKGNYPSFWKAIHSTIGKTEFRNFPGSPVLGIGIIPGGGTKSLHAGPCCQKKREIEYFIHTLTALHAQDHSSAF